MNLLTKPLTTRTFAGCLAVWFSLISVMSVLYAMDNTGLASLFGWFGFGIATLAVFYTHTWDFEDAEQFSGPLGGWGFKVAFFVMVSVQLVMITDKAGVL